jgi:tetratricopeptide (TPR) repeat protein
MCKILKRREDTYGGASSVPKCSASPAVLNTADAARIKRWRKMIDIGHVLGKEGEYDKAVQTFQRCLSEFADVEDAECLAATFHGVATGHSQQSEFAKSIVFYEKALAILLNVLGAEHPNVAGCYGNMAALYYAQGDKVKGLELYGKCLAIQLKVLGAEHPDVANSYGGMASVYSDQGYPVKALKLHEKALSIQVKVLGAERPGTTATQKFILQLKKDIGA